MTWIADENVDRQIVTRLRENGHDVFSVAEILPGIKDSELLHLVRSRGAILITSDKELGHQFLRQGRASTGLVLIWLAGLTGESKAARLIEALGTDLSRFRGALTVITATALRSHSVVGKNVG